MVAAPQTRLTDKHFIDWESETFGYGYGTGELPIMRCLHQFFASLKDGQSYDYRVLEAQMGDAAAWFLINALCRAKVINYGCSPRFGFIDHVDGVEALRDYVLARTPEQLHEILVGQDDDYVYCYKGHCNCDEPCNNPLF